MPLRVKWFKTSPIDKTALEVVLGCLNRDEYSDKRKWGFANISSRGSFLEAQYVERIDTVIKMNDPFGKTLEFNRIEYESFYFSLGTKFPNLELRDAPRSLGGFFNELARYLNFKLSVEPIEVDLSLWIKAFEDECDSLEVYGAWVSNIPLSNAVEARVTLIGSAEVRPLIKKITGKYSYVYSKMQVTGLFRSQPFRCDLYSDGRASISLGVEPEVKRILKIALLKAIKI